jgi:hypothetical protein
MRGDVAQPILPTLRSAKPKKRRGCPQQARAWRAGEFHPVGNTLWCPPKEAR